MKAKLKDYTMNDTLTKVKLFQEARDHKLSGAMQMQPPSLASDSPIADPEPMKILTLNIAGLQFQTKEATLGRFPDTLLGNPSKRGRFYDETSDQYFFNRHRASFEAILYIYQSDGCVRRPAYVPLNIFLDELFFFQMTPKILADFWKSEGYVKPTEQPIPQRRFQALVWELMERPDSSIVARILACVSVFVIVVSVVSFCLETIPALNTPYSSSANNTSELASDTEDGGGYLNWGNPFFCVEFACILWFTVEFIVRFLSSPSKLDFCRNFLNIVDFIAVVPFYVKLAVPETASRGSAMSFTVLRVLRLIRVFRIFKLSRHSRGLQILIKTFAASFRELCLLVFFLMILLILFSTAVYFADSGDDKTTKFTSIPASFWFVIVTMTTVGYGDMVPEGPWGKLVGCMCAVTGILVQALPVPVIVANFRYFYRLENRLAQMQPDNDTLDEIKRDNDSISSGSEF